MSISLKFDRGTITLAGCREAVAAGLPGVLWDPRVKGYRAPGHCYASLKAALADSNRGALIVDDTVQAPQHRVPPRSHAEANGTWKDTQLRHYQIAALDAWEQAQARGEVHY